MTAVTHRIGTLPRRPVVGAYFGVLVVIGLLIHRDFGMSWDEPWIHDYGDLLLEHYGPGGAWEDFSILRYYGPVVAVLTGVVARLSPSQESAYPLAHLLYFAIFVVGVVAFYKLCARQFGSWAWGLAGATLLVLSPRVFSHAFVNPKDAPLMAAFIVTVHLLVRYLDTGRPAWLAACGVATAVAIDIRVVAVFLVVLVAGTVLADGMLAGERTVPRSTLLSLGAYGAAVVPLTLLLWPYLWEDPIGRLLDTLRIMASFDAGPEHTLYAGEVVAVADTPWHYIPVWVGITTPVPYLACAVVGLRTLARNPLPLFRQGSADRLFFVHGAWLLLPVLVAIAGRSALYDEWRQLLFVYPALLVFAVAGMKSVSDWASARPARPRRARAVVAAAAVATFGWTAYRMAALHPYEAVYFNALVGGAEGAEGRFELDYWGLSYREGLDHLLTTRPAPVSVNACTAPGVDSARLFEERGRLAFVSADEAELAICAPRGQAPAAHLPDRPTEFSVRRDGVTLLHVKRLRPAAHPAGHDDHVSPHRDGS